MNNNEKLGIKDLLSELDQEIVFSLAATATKKAVVPTTVLEAIDAVILHSDSAMWLLNRKKLTRANLFQYLNGKRVEISGQAEKHAIAERIIKLWNDSAKTQITSANDCVTMECHAAAESSPQTEKMGITFAQWFYGILLNISNRTPGPSIADQFWTDSKLTITLNHSGAADRSEAFGSEEAEKLFKQLLVQHNLILNPNLSDGGVGEKQNAHGLVVIAVCGVCYVNGNCSGIFEQAFGMVRDPAAEFRWRIKWSDLRVTQAVVNNVPCISDLPELLSICNN